ncbi:unnamed protein product [Medioppia subpectinata]|uniref:OBG-type G domain-containing protein n=1 Tax=Medioppia subpectinata TaxID=1979941 RepID=A0A7R9PX59_9ACAR|nr:unnamed protein product [Medioppia subpectinata]CAG2104455.1 unnamed protein product [Medioppia subpectinata]
MRILPNTPSILGIVPLLTAHITGLMHAHNAYKPVLICNLPEMPPKKDSKDTEKTVLLGRISTQLKVGIVGVPNVGKSTFFNVLTSSEASAENFPFCTIDPNENKYSF